MPDLNEAIKRVHGELDRVRQFKKCTSCECFLDVLEAVQVDLGEIGTSQAEAARTDIQRWSEEGNKNRHHCLGCEVCLPIEPYNQFNAWLSKSEAGPSAAPEEGVRQQIYSLPPSETPAPSPCDCGSMCAVGNTGIPAKETEPAQRDGTQEWPVVEGDYLVGDPSARVAICTLADTNLPTELKAAGLLERAAIVGPLSTENLGIERVIRNVVSNPNIGILILCGRDSRGHRAGQGILALKASGADENRRIIGALGLRPVLKNLTGEELERFRERVTVVDEIGTRDVDRLAEVVEACLAQPKNSPPALPPKVHQPKVVEAQRLNHREWVHDPEGFFLVLLDREAGAIVCEHYTQDGVLNEVIRGARAKDVTNTAIKRGLLSRLDHAAYLGRELAKAESALVLGLTYVQDEPLKPAVSLN